jgi:glycosyltransferase involved in cell wall biosynthesis
MLSATLFAYPRNIGLSVLHAFGYGVPVVTSADLSTHNPEREALEDGVNSLLFKDGSAADFADKCAAILRDPDLRRKLSIAALATVSSEFSLMNMVTGMRSAIVGVSGER